MRRTVPALLALALIGAATLMPGAGAGGMAIATPDPADLLLNIVLFVPLGMALRGPPSGRADHGRPLRVVLPAAALLSLGIELAQLTLIPGRDSSPWDLLANTLGAGLGAASPSAWLAAPLPIAWLASGWLLTPVPPPTAHWWGQWAHPFGSPVPFSGTIQAATFAGLPTPEGPLGPAATAQLQARYQSPPMVLSVRFTPASTPSPGRIQVAGIADGAGGEVIGLWQLGWDLELRWHARGTRWRLRHPALRAPNLLQDLPKSISTISGSLEPGHAFVETNSAHRFGLRLGPWEGWRLLWPLEVPRPPIALLVSVLWTAGCLGLPIAALVRSRRRNH